MKPTSSVSRYLDMVLARGSGMVLSASISLTREARPTGNITSRACTMTSCKESVARTCCDKSKHRTRKGAEYTFHRRCEGLRVYAPPGQRPSENRSSHVTMCSKCPRRELSAASNSGAHERTASEMFPASVCNQKCCNNAFIELSPCLVARRQTDH